MTTCIGLLTLSTICCVDESRNCCAKLGHVIDQFLDPEHLGRNFSIDVILGISTLVIGILSLTTSTIPLPFAASWTLNAVGIACVLSALFILIRQKIILPNYPKP